MEYIRLSIDDEIATLKPTYPEGSSFRVEHTSAGEIITVTPPDPRLRPMANRAIRALELDTQMV